MSIAQPVVDNDQATPASRVTVLAESKTFGILSLILGVVSIVAGHTLVVPVAAIVLGVLGLRREPSTRVFSVWGIVLGGVMLAIPVLAVTLGFALIAPLGIFAIFGGF